MATTYVVFKVGENLETPDRPKALVLTELGEPVEAHSDLAAVRQASAGKAGEYVAIPSRSLRRRKVATERVERVKVT